jgi:hypothetical protein
VKRTEEAAAFAFGQRGREAVDGGQDRVEQAEGFRVDWGILARRVPRAKTGEGDAVEEVEFGAGQHADRRVRRGRARGARGWGGESPWAGVPGRERREANRSREVLAGDGDPQAL